MRKNAGFTLIELAIVLVIIGIILGAIIKGQDLIQNARMKKLATQVRVWETALWTCYDRLGYFPGDTNQNGLIDSDPLNNSCVSNLANPPVHNVRLGSYTFYIYAGNTNNDNDGEKNVIAVCGASNCGSASADTTYADYLRSVDRTIDGIASATDGLVQVIGSITVSSNAVTAASPGTSDYSSSSTGLLYFFDRK